MKDNFPLVRAKNSDNPRSEVTSMRKKFQQVGLVAFGAALGVAASLHFSAVADRQVSALQLPIDDLRLFSEVFGRIKSDYVEPVEDRKLLKEAINGMLTGLDPHSASRRPIATCRWARRASSAASASRSAPKRAS